MKAVTNIPSLLLSLRVLLALLIASSNGYPACSMLLIAILDDIIYKAAVIPFPETSAITKA